MIRVMGIGSPFGDDQLGWRVAELLKNAPQLNGYLKGRLDIQASDRPGLSLFTALSRVHVLYLIDALMAQTSAVGEICQINIENLISRKSFFSTHGFDVAVALELANSLKKVPSQTIVYAIKINEVSYQKNLSPRVEKACQELTRQLIEELCVKLG